MATDIIWPSDLRGTPIRQGYSETSLPQSVKSPVGSGSIKSRRRFTQSLTSMTFRLGFNGKDLRKFEKFVDETLFGNSLSFHFPHPRYVDDDLFVEVILTGDSLTKTQAGHDQWIVDINMQRVDNQFTSRHVLPIPETPIGPPLDTSRFVTFGDSAIDERGFV